MKKIMFSLLILTSLNTLAESIQLERITEATFCRQEMSPGSTNRINIEGESMLIDLINDNSRNLNTLKEVAPGKCSKVDIVGYRVYEGGHFPNPMVPFQVFKILEINKARKIILGE